MSLQTSMLFQTLFLFMLLQNTESSSLCYTAGPCWLSVLKIAVCTCQSQTPTLPPPPPDAFSLVTINSFSKSENGHILDMQFMFYVLKPLYGDI